MRTGTYVAPPMDFRFLDLFLILLLSAITFAAVALLRAGEARGRPLQITTANLAEVIIGRSSVQSLQAVGGSPPYVWTARTAPAGVRVETDGLVRANVQRSGALPLDVVLRDSGGREVTRRLQLNAIDAAPVQPLRIVTAQLPIAVLGRQYVQTLAAEGGVLPYVWHVDGLPPGLSSANESVDGVPTVEGDFTLTPDTARFAWR